MIRLHTWSFGVQRKSHFCQRRYLESSPIRILEQGIRFVSIVARVSLRFGIKRQPRSDRVFRAVLRNADADTVAHDLVKLHEVLVGVLVVTKSTRFGVEGNLSS